MADRHEVPKKDDWNFAWGEPLLQNKKLLIDFHFGHALTLTLKMFEYEGLPDTIPYRELEKILQLNAFGYWLKKDGQLYVFWGGLGGRPNAYYQPTKFIVANPYLQFFDTVEVNKEGVLMWNDYAHMGNYLLLRRYAELMAECDITLRFGLINARIVSVLHASNDTAKASAQLFLDDVAEGKKLGVVMGEGVTMDDKDELGVNDYRKANAQDLKDVMELQQYIKASFYNDIGLQANYNMKREAINGNEAGMNEESLKPFIDDMLESRQEAIKRINEQFGTNITVKLSSSWVRREKIAKDETEETQKEEKKDDEETPVEEEKQEKKGDNE